MYVTTQKYIVDIETIDGLDRLTIQAESLTDMHEQVSEEDDFVRIKEYKNE